MQIRHYSLLSCLAWLLAALPATAQEEHAPSPEPSVTWLRINEPAWMEARLAVAVSLEFAEVPLGEVVATISRAHGVPVWVDEHALDREALSPDIAVTYACQNVPLRQALTELASTCGLVWRPSARGIDITAPWKLENDLTTRAYPVLDLLVPTEDLQPQACFSGTVAGEWDAGNLIDMLASTIEPTSWEMVGGIGAMEFHPGSGALVISHTAEVQAKVEDYLAVLRRARAINRQTQPAADPEKLVLRVYRVNYLYGDPAGEETAAELVEALVAMIEPATWQAGGGAGRMRVVGDAIFIRATPAVQAQVRVILEYQERLNIFNFTGGMPVVG